MFDDQAIRLIREKWPNATMLAEELYAILTAERPAMHNGPIVINNETDQTPLIIRNLGDAPFSIEIISKDPAKSDGFKNTGIDNDGNPVPDEEEEEEEDTGGAAFCWPGQIVSGPSGSNYQVDVYENGTSVSATSTVTCRIANVTSGTLTAGDWIVVMQLGEGAGYEGFASVWLQ